MANNYLGANQNNNILVEALLAALSKGVNPVSQDIQQLPPENLGRIDIVKQFPQQQVMPQPNISQPMTMPQTPQNVRPKPQLDENGQTAIGRFLSQMGIPLATTAVGLAGGGNGITAGAAGFQGGYQQGRQQKFENKLAKEEQDRKNKLSSFPSDTIPEGFEVVGYDQKGSPMIRKIKRDVQSEKFDAQQQEKMRQQEQASQFVKDSAMDSLKTIQEVENGINNFGLFGGIPSIPGSERANWEANVNKLLSEKVIKLITDMKQASRTGATGFGQLNIKELGVLENASTALKKTTNPNDARKYLNDMKASLNKVLGSDMQMNGQQDVRSQYNALREQGMSAEEAKQRLGL